MTTILAKRWHHRTALCLLALLIATVATPPRAHAEAAPPETTEARLRRIEGQLRALQRKVFPEGAGKIFAPEITPDAALGDGAAPPPAPSGNAAAFGDVLIRIDAIEAQMRALTANSEDSQHRFGTMETRIAAVEAAQAHAAAEAAAAAEHDAGAQAAAKAAADRAAALAAIERPVTADKGDDAYTYGFRLREAGLLPEAQAVLTDFVKQYPRHRRISYARNLLGRALLDDHQPGPAAQWFVQNYQADKTGERAADSLLYLASAMTQLKQVKRACAALEEFRQVYASEGAGRLKAQYDTIAGAVTCH